MKTFTGYHDELGNGLHIGNLCLIDPGHAYLDFAVGAVVQDKGGAFIFVFSLNGKTHSTPLSECHSSLKLKH